MTSLSKHIGSRAQLRRLHLRLSRSVVATHLGITVLELERFEAGQERMPARQLLILAEVIGVSMEYFFQNFQVDIIAPPTDQQVTQLVAVFRTIKSDELRAYIVELSTVVARSERGLSEPTTLN